MGASIDKLGRRMRLWFNPDRDGEDVFLQVLDDGRVLLTWSYGNDQRQVWLVGAGSSDPYGAVDIPLSITDGARFGTGVVASDVSVRD